MDPLYRDGVIHVVLRIEEEGRRQQQLDDSDVSMLFATSVARTVQLGGPQTVHVQLRALDSSAPGPGAGRHAPVSADAVSSSSRGAGTRAGDHVSICTSIGAVSPKFSTWLTMSAVGNRSCCRENVRAAWREWRDVVVRRMVLWLQRDEDLRVHLADVVARHEGQVERRRHADRVVGWVSISPAGMILRMLSSTCSTSSSVRSSRVPGGAR